MANLEFNLICRLCVKLLQTDNMSPIFNNNLYVDKVSLPDRIKYCFSLEVAEDDGMPPQICSSCLYKLNQSFTFRNQCILADLTLKHLKDLNFKVSELPNLFKIDIENQIISTEDENIIKDVLELGIKQTEIKNESNLDKYNGNNNKQNKRNLKHKSKLVQDLNEITKHINGSSEASDEYSLDLNGNASECSLPVIPNKKKANSRKQKTVTAKHSKKPRTTRGNKGDECGKSEEKLEKNVEAKSEINFTVEPEIISFIEIMEEKESLDSNISGSSIKNIKKVAKPKLLGIKKKRTKKLATAKEKQSSYTCDYCKKVYPSEGGWRYHIHTIHNQNYQPFICDLCGQAFKVKKNLEGHKNSIHFHLKLHLCDLCGRGFATKYALKVHKIWHNDEKNFTCDICGTKFRTRGKMNTHRSIHGGPKNFMCHICSRDFRWKKDFEIHMRTHTGEKPFKCSHCGKAFASLTNMKKHERKHVDKLALVKNSQEFQDLAETVEETLCRNDFLSFGYDSVDVRKKQINHI